MATQIKHFSLLLLASLLAATCFSCASASDLRGFEGGRKLLQGLTSKTIGFHTDYAPATTHPPDDDYPPPGEYSLKTVGFHTDYAPATTHPPDDDYPPPGEDLKTVGFHTDYAPATTHPPYNDYPPPAEDLKTVGFHADYAPATTHPPDDDYPPPGLSSSKTVGFQATLTRDACSVAEGCAPPS